MELSGSQLKKQKDTQTNKERIKKTFVTSDNGTLLYFFALQKGCSSNIMEHEALFAGFDLTLHISIMYYNKLS